MDLGLTDEQQDLRRRAAAWLAANRPTALPEALDDRVRALQDWQRRLYDAGFLGIGWPEEFGGSGGTLLDRIVFNEELARSHAPLPVGLVSLEVVGPTILEFGTDAQRHRLLPPLLRGDELWCQGFSEPDAGSDLAALRTRAVPASDGGWRIDGQKVWTSWAQYATWSAVLARTDSEVPRHRGISYLLVEMDQPGVSVRPIEQMTGDPEFSELFLDGVHAQADMVLGGVDDGWRVAMATLGYERGPFMLRQQVELRAALDEVAADLARRAGGAPHAKRDAQLVRELGRAEVLVDTLGAMGVGAATRLQAGDGDMSQNSVDKLFLGEVEQAVHAVAFDSLGPARTVTLHEGEANERWIHDYLYARAASIYGGTSQIQRNIIASRLLHLPKA